MLWVMINMENQNALTSTAMLASIWEKEKKDTIELILPFVIYAIGKTTSPHNQVDISSVSDFVAHDFGFHQIPHSVLQKVLTRLNKKGILTLSNRKFFLKDDLSGECSKIDFQLNSAKSQTSAVVERLTDYFNQRKEYLLKKDITKEDGEKFFVSFLETKGYFVFAEISKLRDISAYENTMNYRIAQFILTEYDNKTDLFQYINNIVTGLLLSRVVYGYTDLQYKEKIKDLCVFFDTTLLLHIFGFKSAEENTAASQLIEILKSLSVPVKCFQHNYSEVHRILGAYKHNVLNPANRYGQTLEYFDKLKYSADDMNRVIANLDEYFKEKNIEVVDIPSLSGDGTGVISSVDFSSAVGEASLKKHLSESIPYRSDEALTNDVSSISAIFTLRRGKSYKKIEQCKALFVTTNRRLAYSAQKHINDIGNTVPLLINDLDLTTLLWLKSHKRHSDLPTLKLIETARLSLEPTEQIREAIVRKIEQFKSEPAVTEERAASYRQLMYTEKERVMELIGANPENVPNIQLNDLERLSRQHYNAELTNEIQCLKRQFDETKRKLWAEASDRMNSAGNAVENALKATLYIVLVALLAVGVVGLLRQEQGRASVYSVSILVFSIIGFVDTIVPRLRHIDKLIKIPSNKRKAQVRNQEQMRIQKILDDLEQ